MRGYRRNSPQAAARIVALAMVADGHLCKAELDILRRLDVESRLGLAPAELSTVTHALCQDLLESAHGGWPDASQVDSQVLSGLLAAIDDIELRRRVLRLYCAVVEADDLVTDGESSLLVATVEHWGMHREMLHPAGARHG